MAQCRSRTSGKLYPENYIGDKVSSYTSANLQCSPPAKAVEDTMKLVMQNIYSLKGSPLKKEKGSCTVPFLIDNNSMNAL